MTVNRFNWDSWDIVVNESTSGQEGDIYRTDYKYSCSTEIPGTSANIPITPTPVIELSGCDLHMPPRIDFFNIMKSVDIEIKLYGNGIY